MKRIRSDVNGHFYPKFFSLDPDLLMYFITFFLIIKGGGFSLQNLKFASIDLTPSLIDSKLIILLVAD